MIKRITNMKQDEVRLIKISREALFEFIYEKFIESQDDYLNVKATDVSDFFEIGSDIQGGMVSTLPDGYEDFCKSAFWHKVCDEKKALTWAKNHGADPQPDERIKVVAHVPEIQRGDSGQAVEVWQTILGIDADGDFGPTTQAYTIAFQRKMGLTADGIVGKTTWNKGLYLD